VMVAVALVLVRQGPGPEALPLEDARDTPDLGRQETV